MAPTTPRLQLRGRSPSLAEAGNARPRRRGAALCPRPAGDIGSAAQPVQVASVPSRQCRSPVLAAGAWTMLLATTSASPSRRARMAQFVEGARCPPPPRGCMGRSPVDRGNRSADPAGRTSPTVRRHDRVVVRDAAQADEVARVALRRVRARRRQGAAARAMGPRPGRLAELCERAVRSWARGRAHPLQAAVAENSRSRRAVRLHGDLGATDRDRRRGAPRGVGHRGVDGRRHGVRRRPRLPAAHGDPARPGGRPAASWSASTRRGRPDPSAASSEAGVVVVEAGPCAAARHAPPPTPPGSGATSWRCLGPSRPGCRRAVTG